MLRSTGARGLMMGRSAIRNPWLFTQIRTFLRGEPVSPIRGRDVLDYVRSLYEVACHAGMAESSKVQRLKKFTNFIGLGVDPKGEFLHQIRRVTTRTEFFDVCENFLDHDRLMSLDPYPLVLGDGDMLAGVHH